MISRIPISQAIISAVPPNRIFSFGKMSLGDQVPDSLTLGIVNYQGHFPLARQFKTNRNRAAQARLFESSRISRAAKKSIG